MQPSSLLEIKLNLIVVRTRIEWGFMNHQKYNLLLYRHIQVYSADMYRGDPKDLILLDLIQAYFEGLVLAKLKLIKI